MRVTEHFGLDATQGSVDFVDVDVHGDVPVYVDPTAIRNQTGLWAESCVRSLRSFFETLLGALSRDDSEILTDLIENLEEPNETHLGDSAGSSNGHSIGTKATAAKLLTSLRTSKAAKSGLLIDLEDTVLMVPGVGKDIISDITTCVIRQYLIDYTQQQCRLHKIPLELQRAGPVWDLSTCSWFEGNRSLPRAGDKTLLLVPKAIVRVNLTIDQGKYYRGYLRPIFEQDVLAHPSQGLVRVLRDGSRVVHKAALDKKIGTAKTDLVRNSARYPSAFQAYKSSLASADTGPLASESLEQLVGGRVETLHALVEEVLAVPAGPKDAHRYHRSVARLFSALFSEVLGNQQLEARLDGRRVDIMYDNVARAGFFWWVSEKASPAPLIVVECKNYKSDIGNREFDQIAMRFSDQRGKIGLLVSRTFTDKPAALHRAQVISTEKKSYVLVLDDDDLQQLVVDYERAQSDEASRLAYPLLRERFNRLIGLVGT